MFKFFKKKKVESLGNVDTNQQPQVENPAPTGPVDQYQITITEVGSSPIAFIKMIMNFGDSVDLAMARDIVKNKSSFTATVTEGQMNDFVSEAKANGNEVTFIKF